MIIDPTHPLYPYFQLHSTISDTPIPHNVVQWDTIAKKGVRAKHAKQTLFATRRNPEHPSDTTEHIVHESFTSNRMIPVIKIPQQKYSELKPFIDQIVFDTKDHGIVVEIVKEVYNRPSSMDKEPQ